MDFLRQASKRSTALAVVLNRVPPEAIDEVTTHLREMLDEAELTDAMLFSIPEAPLDNGRIPSEAIGSLTSWLDTLISSAENRSVMVRQTLDGTLATLGPRVETIAAHLDAQTAATAELRQAVDRSYTLATDQVAEGLSGGAILRGEVIDRWQELVGTGDIMSALQSRIGWVRDRLKSFFQRQGGTRSRDPGRTGIQHRELARIRGRQGSAPHGRHLANARGWAERAG